MKRLKIRIEGHTHPPYRLQIRPGTTCLDVLTHLNLTADYVLSTISVPSKTFTPAEDLYAQIANDQKLIATLSPEAVEKYSHTFLQ